MTDEPIVEQAYIGGVTVVDFGDMRVARGMTRRPVSTCKHRALVYDPKERRIWCKDCEKDIDNFDAFVLLTEQFASAHAKLKKREDRLTEVEGFQARSLATKALDAVWRRRNVLPACPHCSNGLFPEDFKNGVKTTIGRQFAEARLGRNKK